MSIIYNIYCDESCHLEHDGQKAMVLGAIWCPQQMAADFNGQIAKLKAEYGLSRYFEIKWGKVSPGKLPFYEALVNLFFDSASLNFRAWIVPDKSVLEHDQFAQTHDEWYYKMYFYMLSTVIRPNTKTAYHVYMDIKDTRSRDKLQKLHDVLANANYDFDREMISRMQHVHSHDIGLLQLADVLIGTTSYVSREMTGSSAKQRLVELVRKRSGVSLKRNTLPSATKVNLCYWRPRERGFDVL